jgi:hypothetical protein
MLSRLGLVAALLLTISATSAQAETDFPVIGGPGNGPFEDRCPPGQYLQGFMGFAGAWVNQIQIVCVKLARAAATMQDGYVGQPYKGTERGEIGEAGAVTVLCTRGQVITGIEPRMTEGNRQVKFIALACGDADGKYDGRPLFVGPNSDRTKDINLGPDRPQKQLCPEGEAGVGVRGRYGLDLNAISLICFNFDTPETIKAPPPSYNNELQQAVQAMSLHGIDGVRAAPLPPPRVSNAGKPIKVTGAGGVAPRPTSGFNGNWSVTSNLGAFEIDLLLVNGRTMGAELKGNSGLNSGAHGVQVDATHAHLTLNPNPQNHTGSLDLTLSDDGNSLTGTGALSGFAVTLQGTPMAAAH